MININRLTDLPQTASARRFAIPQAEMRKSHGLIAVLVMRRSFGLRKRRSQAKSGQASLAPPRSPAIPVVSSTWLAEAD
jgi:hypothetical protein